MNKPPATFTAARILILACASIWLIFAVIVASGAHPSYAGSHPLRWVMSAMALLAGLALLAFYYFLGKRSRLAYILGVVLLIFILLLTVTDQIGWIDAAVLIITLAPIVLLLANRKWYFNAKHRSKGSVKLP